jgi:PIN domain nuclease of toxin-antitoxin system
MTDVNVSDLRQNLPAHLERARQFGDAFPGDPADRLIAATALVRNAPLVTHDDRLREVQSLQTIW